MAAGDQIIHRLKCRILLLEEDAALAGAGDVAVNHHQRFAQGFRQGEDRLLTHKAGIENNGVAVAVRQHFYRLNFTLRGIVAVGHH